MNPNHSRRRWQRRTTILVLGLTVAGLTAGCSSPVAITPTPSTSVSPGTPERSAGPSPSATAIAATTPAPTPAASVRPVVGIAPGGPWASVNWIDAGNPLPPMPATDPETFEVHVFGWSRGFVAFGSDGGPGIGSTAPATLAATSSADGLSWTAPRGIALTGLDDRIDIVKVVEGPAGLVAVGQVPQGTCGGPSTVGALWTSTDGRAWHRVALPKAFSAVQVDMLDAGSAGYIASNPTYDNTAPVVWLSQDGRTWRSTPLSRSTFGKVIVDGTTSFAGGYVLAGAVVGEGGCGGPALVTPSIWWSADGDAWSRSPLSGATPKDNAYMTVSRISDHAVVANARTYDAATDSMSHQVWLTGDGRHWAPVAAPSTLNDNRILTDGARGMIVLEPVDNVGPPTLAAVGDDLAVTILRQTGPGPLADESIVGWTSALGPTGIVTLTADKGHLWLGVPAG